MQAYVSQIKSDLQVAPEVIRELWIHFQDLQDIISVDFVQVTVRQCSHICT